MWTAGVAGGIWKSTDGGASWQPKGDLLVNIAVNSLIQDPAQDNVLYAGTGEGFFNGDAVRGQGIFKSTDYGETWTQLASTDNSNFFYVQKLAATRHKTKQRIYAATRTGVFRSTDGGATWTKVLDATAVNGCMDLAIQYLQEDKARTTSSRRAAPSRRRTVWRALDVDAGQTWEPVLSEPTWAAHRWRSRRRIRAWSTRWLPTTTSRRPIRKNHALRAVYRSSLSNGAAGTLGRHACSYDDREQAEHGPAHQSGLRVPQPLRLRHGRISSSPRAGTTTRSPSIPRTRTSSGPRASI